MLFKMGSAGLVRQNMPVQRIALWWGAYNLAWSLMNMTVLLLAAALKPAHHVLGAAALMTLIVFATPLLLLRTNNPPAKPGGFLL